MLNIKEKIVNTKKYKLIKKYEQIIMSSIPDIKFGFSDKEREASIIKIIDTELIDFSQTIIKEFSKENLNLFFHNIKDIKIYKAGLITLYYRFIHGSIASMVYDVEKNRIVFLPVCSKMEKLHTKHTLNHEFFHMSSAYKDEKNNKMYSGFSIREYNSVEIILIGSGLNEGYTELMTQRYFKKSADTFLTYQILAIFAEYLEEIVGKEKMETLYLNANLNGLIKILLKYDNIENLIDFINSLDCIKNNYKDLDMLYDDVEKIRKYLVILYAKTKSNLENCLSQVQNFDALLCKDMKDIGINIYPYDEEDIFNLVSFDSKISCNNVR